VAGSRSIIDLHLYVDDRNQYLERSKIEQEKSSTFDHNDKNLSFNADGRIDITDLIFDRSSSKADRESDREINQKDEFIIKTKEQSAERLPAPSASMEIEI
jgi:hypothetical protein